jgi:hypothetical protein
LAQPQDVRLVIYDILGRQVKTLIDEHRQPGAQNVTFDASNFTSGVYFYCLRAGEYSETRKMILLK